MSKTEPEQPNQADRDAARERAVGDALRALIRDLAKRRFGHLPAGKSLDLDLRVSIEPEDDWHLRFDPPLQEQILARVEGVEASWDVYQAGAVYCFQCQRCDCEHSRPPEALDVFQAYDSTGCPKWSELAQMLLDLGEERVDSLFGENKAIIAVPVRGRDLRTRQLHLYGKASRTYALLGQVVAGYFRMRPVRGQEDLRFAVTFQAVEVRTNQGKPALELNALAALPHPWPDLVPEHCPWLEKARRSAADALKNLEAKVLQHLEQDKPSEARRVMARVPAILRRLASDLEQGARQDRRQTKHAKHRREIRRPVDKALDDLRSARPERMFVDLKTSAIAVCGSKGRCHIFNDNGRHITSFKIDNDAINQRVRKNRWEPMAAQHRQAFLDRAL